MPSLAGAVTQLGLTGAPTRPYGSFTKGLPPVTGHSGAFTRLGLIGVPTRLYGSFAGKTAASLDDKAGALSAVPVLTIGPFQDIDLELTVSIIPKATMLSVVARPISASMTIKPVATQAKSGVGIAGTFPKTASLSVVPVTTMAVTMQKSLPSDAQSVVPVLTMSASVDTANIEALASLSVVPVATMASSVLATVDQRAAALSVIPVATMTISLLKQSASLEHTVVLTASPRLTMSSTMTTVGEVDKIVVTARQGYIRVNEK